MKKLTWPAIVIAAALIFVGTWGSTVIVTASDAKDRVVTAGAAKAVTVEKTKSVAKNNTLNIEIVKDTSTTKKGEVAGIPYDKLVMANVDEAVNVRDSASEDGKLLGKFYKECGGRILEEGDGWTKVKTGDLTGCTLNGDFGYLSMQDVFWKNANKPYNKDGRFLFTGIEDVNGWMEGAKGTLTSSSFTIGGCGYITFKLGGGYNQECYIEIVDASNDQTIAKYHNDNADYNEGRMFQFKADLSEFMGREVYIRVVDNASEAWGCLAVDSFITHYNSIDDLPTATLIESK